jgi:hypothetical protein
VHYPSQRGVREGLHQVYGGSARTPHRLGNVTSFVALRAGAGKAIGFDEDYSGIVRREPPRPAQNRMEAWESLLGGCATYDHLDFTFTPGDPTGSAAGPVPPALPREWFDGRTLRRQLSYVAGYAADLDLAGLRPDLVGVQQTPPGVGAVAARTSGAGGGRPGGIAVYLADARPLEHGFGEAPLEGMLCLGGASPGARYDGRALDPRAGRWTDLAPVAADGLGSLRVAVPAFRHDLLVELTPSPGGAPPPAGGAPTRRVPTRRGPARGRGGR